MCLPIKKSYVANVLKYKYAKIEDFFKLYELIFLNTIKKLCDFVVKFPNMNQEKNTNWKKLYISLLVFTFVLIVAMFLFQNHYK